MVVFFGGTNFFEGNEHFFQKLESALEVQRANRKFSGNLGDNILELYNVLVQIQLITSKTKRDVYYSKLGIPAVLRVAQRLNTSDLRKSEYIRKILNLGGEFPFEKLNFSYSSQKPHSRYQNFLVLSSFTRFLYFVPNILSRIVGITFQLKLTILIFLTKFTPKRCFQSKTENVNTTIKFCVFDII